MQSDLISRSAVINVLQELADMETCENTVSDIGFGLSMAIGRLVSATWNPMWNERHIVRSAPRSWEMH